MVWVTAEEMHQRLLHLGVRRSLSLGMVLEALQRNNAGQKMVAKWEYQKELWYRSKAVDVADAVPLDQRNQRNGRQKRVGKCKYACWCTFKAVKDEHPDWEDDAIEEEAMARSHRPFGGRNMSLSERGKEVLTSLICQRFHRGSIDKITRGGCSNLSEGFWNVTTKFSEGKRLNDDLADSYEVHNKLAFCRAGDRNVVRTQDQVSERLGLAMSSVGRQHQARSERKRKQVSEYQKSHSFKTARSLARLSKDHRMGKIDSAREHRSGKKPLGESSKSTAAEARKEPRPPRKCSNCRLPGCTKARCKFPPRRKRLNIDLPDFDPEKMALADACGIRAPKKLKNLDLVPIGDWI